MTRAHESFNEFIIYNLLRFLVLESASIPKQEIIPVMMENLPLKEDKDEYEMIFKALTKLYAAGIFLQIFEYVIKGLKA